MKNFVWCRMFIQFMCGYSTLPLYALVNQVCRCNLFLVYEMNDCCTVLTNYLIEMEHEMKMGSSFKKAIFDEQIQGGLVGWAKTAKTRVAAANAAVQMTNQ